MIKPTQPPNTQRNSRTVRSTRLSKHIVFNDALEEIFEVESLIYRDTTWGDVWDDLYWTEDEMADFRYQAFLEECEKEQ